MWEHTKYISCGSHGFKEKDFLSFSHYKSMENLDPKGGAVWTTGERLRVKFNI